MSRLKTASGAGRKFTNRSRHLVVVVLDLRGSLITDYQLITNHQSSFLFQTRALIPKFTAMNAPNYRVRRATLDDIGQLTALWQSMNFPIEELSRRITDFQVAETAEGTIVGVVALQMAERQGRIHSEAFTDFATKYGWKNDPGKVQLGERLAQSPVSP